MADLDATLPPVHLEPVQDCPIPLEDGRATTLQRLASLSSHLAGVHPNAAAQDVAITETNLRLDRSERRLDLREEA